MHRVDTFDRTSLVLKNKMNNNLQEKIMHNLEQGSSVYVCFRDASNAFDTVWEAWTNV